MSLVLGSGAVCILRGCVLRSGQVQRKMEGELTSTVVNNMCHCRDLSTEITDTQGMMMMVVAVVERRGERISYYRYKLAPLLANDVAVAVQTRQRFNGKYGAWFLLTCRYKLTNQRHKCSETHP